jgi:hypothetical protein
LQHCKAPPQRAGLSSRSSATRRQLMFQRHPKQGVAFFSTATKILYGGEAAVSRISYAISWCKSALNALRDPSNVPRAFSGRGFFMPTYLAVYGRPCLLREIPLMLGKFSMSVAIAATLMIPTTLSAQVGAVPNVGPSVRGSVERGIPGPLPAPGARGVVVERGGPIVGRRYHGGIWYGTGRRFWRGRWYAYGVGPCWRPSPIGFVWICG